MKKVNDVSLHCVAKYCGLLYTCEHTGLMTNYVPPWALYNGSTSWKAYILWVEMNDVAINVVNTHINTHTQIKYHIKYTFKSKLVTDHLASATSHSPSCKYFQSCCCDNTDSSCIIVSTRSDEHHHHHNWILCCNTDNFRTPYHTVLHIQGWWSYLSMLIILLVIFCRWFRLTYQLKRWCQKTLMWLISASLYNLDWLWMTSLCVKMRRCSCAMLWQLLNAEGSHAEKHYLVHCDKLCNQSALTTSPAFIFYKYSLWTLNYMNLCGNTFTCAFSQPSLIYMQLKGTTSILNIGTIRTTNNKKYVYQTVGRLSM